MRRLLVPTVLFAGLPVVLFAQRAAPAPGALERLSEEFTALAQRVSPSVVRIEAKGLATGQGAGGTRPRGTRSLLLCGWAPSRRGASAARLEGKSRFDPAP